MNTSIKTQLIDFVVKNGPTHYRDLIKHLRVYIQHFNYDPVRDRGYACDDLHVSPHGEYSTGYFMKPSRREPRYLKRIKRGVFVAVDPLN
jgi:hypothetical protein